MGRQKARAALAVQARRPGRIATIAPLTSPWDLFPPEPPLRSLTLRPDCDPSHRPPSRLLVANGRGEIGIALEPGDGLLSTVHSLLRRHDPDLVLADAGRVVPDPGIMALITAVVRGHGANRKEGLSTGSPISPLLLNTHLHFRHDLPVDRERFIAFWGRYAANLAYLVRTATEGERARDLSRTLLNEVGIWHFDQIAPWKEKGIAHVGEVLVGVRGRITPDEWGKQGEGLGAGGTEGRVCGAARPGSPPGRGRSARSPPFRSRGPRS